MRGLLVSLAVAACCVLAGCDHLTKSQIFGQCRLDAVQFSAIHNKDDSGQANIGNMTDLCMQAHGYRLKNEACPASERVTNALDIQKTMGIIDLQRGDPDCYVASN